MLAVQSGAEECVGAVLGSALSVRLWIVSMLSAAWPVPIAGSAIAGDTNDATMRAAESELRTLAFMAILLKAVSFNRWVLVSLVARQG
jgi:hypothetical protein